jgi:hypothetical protein
MASNIVYIIRSERKLTSGGYVTVMSGQVFLCEIIWKIFSGGKADDGGNITSWCTYRQTYVFVKRLQMRIAKAVKEKRYGKAKAFQRLLTTIVLCQIVSLMQAVYILRGILK